MKTRTRLLQIYLVLLLAATLLLSFRLLADAGPLSGYSLRQMILLIPVLILLLALGWLISRVWREPGWQTRLDDRLQGLLARERFYLAAVLLGAGVILLGAWAYQIGSAIQDPYFQGYFAKIAPFQVWGIAAVAITLLFLRFYRFGLDMQVFRSQRMSFKASGVVLGLLLLLAIFMSLTGWGLRPDLIGWGEPGTPVLPAQVLYLAAFSVAVWVVGESLLARWGWRFTPRLQSVFDTLVFLLFWLLTIWLWQAQPLTPAFFAPEPVAPNFEYYPYSDAANYAVSAQELLLGTGFDNDVRRPLYSLFLALAQLVNGVGYANILRWQIPLLALIPPLLYVLAKGLHSRLAGVMVAGLAIFHEINAIRLSSVVNVSHAKLLMSDLPTALGVIAFTVVLVYWWQAPQRHRTYPLLAGGILALTMLVRSQIAVLLPGALLFIGITFWRQKRQLIAASVLLLTGMIVVLLPWFWRGRQASGSLSLAESAQGFQTRFFGVRYRLEPDSEFGYLLPGETSDQYSRRMLTSAAEFVQDHPLETLTFISAHLLHNQVSTLLTLPPSYATAQPIPYLEKNFSRTWDQCCALQTHIRELPYWLNWDGAFPRAARLPLLFNLILIAIGLGAAWQRKRALALFPLWINLCYALGNGLVRSSGWRFNLPVDWVGLFYYGLGLVQIMFWAGMFFKNRVLPRDPETATVKMPAPPQPFPWGAALLTGSLLFLVGAAIPLTEAVIPLRYAEDWLPQIAAQTHFEDDLAQIGVTAPLADFAAQNNLKLFYGRALYPRYYGPNHGIPDNAWYAFVPQDYARLGFYLVGPHPQNVILPLENAPAHFPHGADVIVLGCSKGQYLEAQLVILPGAQNFAYPRVPQPDWHCNLGE